MASEHTIDARRLLCPLPVIRVQDLVATLAAGDRVEIWCTDPGARHDIPTWCRIHGHRMVAVDDVDGAIRLRLEVRGEP